MLNMVDGSVNPDNNGEDFDDQAVNNENELDEQDNSEEFQALNAQLDVLNDALDNLEKKNDDIHAQLVELLKSNRETREEIKDIKKDDQMEVESSKQ